MPEEAQNPTEAAPTSEPIVSESIPESVIEAVPPSEPVTIEPQIIEPTPTAQPVEPLNPESVSEPQPIPELVSEPLPVPDSIQAPKPSPEPSTAPIETTSTPESEQPQQTIPEPEPEPVPIHTPEPVSTPQPQTSTPPIIQTSLARELLVKAREAIQFRKRKKLEKIMGMFLKQASITNDDVEKLLHISDATATRYLEQLKKEGKIKQSGRTGTGVSYSRI